MLAGSLRDFEVDRAVACRDAKLRMVNDVVDGLAAVLDLVAVPKTSQVIPPDSGVSRQSYSNLRSTD
jgi:hypothetical protein